MKNFKFCCILCLFILLFNVSCMKAENIIPFIEVSASNSDGIMLSENIVNLSGMSENSITAFHDNSVDGATMWCSKAKPLGDVKLTFDLKQTYNLKNLYVWNFNRLDHLDNGIKNMRIEYSSDKLNWNALPKPANVDYEVLDNYPFQLAKASGDKNLIATNLSGNNLPISLSGVKARYIRFVISKKVNEGNWGGNSFGLSEVIFTTDDDVNNTVEVYSDFSKVVNKCGNMLFGGCHCPSLPHSYQMLPLLVDAGFNVLRSDMWLETILPANITLEDYKNNVNDVQNPDNWDFTNMEMAVRAKKAGMKVMMIISYCPAWLSYDGTTKGIPRDMDVYADIVRKVYSRYYKYIDWVEIYNEPGYFMTIKDSPYTSVGAALADIYITCVNVVREITPDMPIGGTSVVMYGDGGVGGSTNRDFFADKRINKDNFNFYSHHVYSDYGIQTEKETVTRVKNLLDEFGYGDLPIYFTEWSSTISNIADTITYTGSKSHTFVGNCLVNWMRDGLTGAMHWNYLQAITENGTNEQGVSVDAHGMYAWDVKGKVGRLLPKAYVFTLLSKTLGLGLGENTVVETKCEENSLNIISLINSKGEKCTVIINNNSTPVDISLNTDTNSLEKYSVTFYEKGLEGEKVDFTDGKAVISLLPMSVTGIKYLEN